MINQNSIYFCDTETREKELKKRRRQTLNFMEKTCVVLDIAHSSSGEVVILDFPPGVTPYLKMKLQDGYANTWTMAGMGLSVILTVLKEKWIHFMILKLFGIVCYRRQSMKLFWRKARN